MSKPIQAAQRSLISLDDRAKRLFVPHTDAPPMRALDALSKLGDQPELRLMAVGLMAFGTFASNDRIVRAGARMLIAHEAATVAKDMMKTNIDRTRPRSAQKTKARKPKKGQHTAKEMTSFPSGHTAGAIAAARALSRVLPEYAAVAFGGATLIAASQIVRCAHYPTDVAAGVLIGLVTEGVTNAAWNAADMDQRSID